MIEYKVSGLIKKTIFDNAITGINNKMSHTITHYWLSKEHRTKYENYWSWERNTKHWKSNKGNRPR